MWAGFNFTSNRKKQYCIYGSSLYADRLLYPPTPLFWWDLINFSYMYKISNLNMCLLHFKIYIKQTMELSKKNWLHILHMSLRTRLLLPSPPHPPQNVIFMWSNLDVILFQYIRQITKINSFLKCYFMHISVLYIYMYVIIG